jgi:hypothetical protein
MKTTWARTTDGWALNVDGSDAAQAFSLPRLELRSSSRGWRSLCFLADGQQQEQPGGAESTLMAAKAAAVTQAARLLGPAYASALLAIGTR